MGPQAGAGDLCPVAAEAATPSPVSLQSRSRSRPWLRLLQWRDAFGRIEIEGLVEQRVTRRALAGIDRAPIASLRLGARRTARLPRHLTLREGRRGGRRRVRGV